MGYRSGKQKNSGRIPLGVLICVLLVISMIAIVSKQSVVYSSGGVFPSTEHGGTNVNGNTVTGVSRPSNTPVAGYTINTTDFPAGGCIHCHDEHGSYDSITHAVDDYMIFDPGGADKNRFCYTCHINPITVSGTYSANNQVWEGQTYYNSSSHGTSASVYWPGAIPTARTAAEAGKCINCHQPHGTTFGVTGDNRTGQVTYALTDPILNMTTRPEENLCLACHDGAPASRNISISFTQAANSGASGIYYNHPISQYNAANDRSPSAHTSLEAKNLTAANRHVECADCHNPHYTGYGGTPLSNLHTNGSNAIGEVLLGVYGVQATYGGTAWVPPSFTVTQLTSTATNYEYELCFRCHSSFSTLPTYSAPYNVTDVSVEFNPNNRSHHGVTAVGRNQSTNANYIATFNCLIEGENMTTCPSGRWGKTSLVACSDCHGDSNNSGAQGPHGADDVVTAETDMNYDGKYILKRYNDAGTMRIICYKCHRRDVYGDAGVAPANGNLSRVSHPLNGQHDVGSLNIWGIWCMNCHGGDGEGGMHGTNRGVGGGGTTSPVGDHFMNGAAIIGITYDTGTRLTCVTTNVVSTYLLSCTAHTKNVAYNYNY